MTPRTEFYGGPFGDAFTSEDTPDVLVNMRPRIGQRTEARGTYRYLLRGRYEFQGQDT